MSLFDAIFWYLLPNLSFCHVTTDRIDKTNNPRLFEIEQHLTKRCSNDILVILDIMMFYPYEMFNLPITLRRLRLSNLP